MFKIYQQHKNIVCRAISYVNGIFATLEDESVIVVPFSRISRDDSILKTVPR